ncbi:MAG: DUF1684 domain-containing protein [Acidobacteriota bacterium]
MRLNLACLLGSALLLSGCISDAPRPVTTPPVTTPPPSMTPATSVTPDPSLSPLDHPQSSVERVAQALLVEREMKDRAFKLDADSPIPAERRQTFTGLAYFPFDASYRFVVKLEPCSTESTIEMATNHPGETRRYRCAGVFRFTVDGVACSLLVLTPDLGVPGAAADLFIPFRDTTAGQETYAAGRYLQLKRRPTNEYVLDFNRAFHPYCAYNNSYSCPLPLPENHLPVAIRAGEKLPEKSSKLK